MAVSKEQIQKELGFNKAQENEIKEMRDLGRCPYEDCGSYDTDCVGDYSPDGDNILVEKWICFDCKRNWNERYKRTGEVEFLD